MKNKYKPINCSFYDVLLEFATKKNPVTLIYQTSDNNQHTSQAIIKDVFTKKGEEFLELATGERIRLDHIISINAHELPKDSSCKIIPNED